MSDLHAMYRLLQECGEDTSCGCGCGKDAKDDKPGKDLNEKPKKSKSEGAELSTAALVKEGLEEARKKIGLRRFRNLKKAKRVAPGVATKLKATPKAASAVRKGAVHNRHR